MKKSAYNFLMIHKKDALFLENIFDRFTDDKPLNIDLIAQESYISKSGITRYFKTNGFDGFKGFKYLLLNESNELKSFNTIEDFEEEIIYEPIKITATLNSIETFQQAIELINEARIINVIGIGGNHSPGYELTNRLKRFGFNAYHQFEINDALLSISNLNCDDLVIVFSYTGESETIIKIAQLASHYETKIIAITKATDSTLAKLANLVLRVDSSDSLLKVMPLKSRMAMIYLVFKLSNYIYENDHEKYYKLFLEKLEN